MKIKSNERKGKHLKADWTFKNCADSFAASELLLQTLAVRTLMASFVFISFILLRPFFSFYHNLTLKWVGLTLESVAALAKSTFSLTWTFLLCSARVYNTLKIAFPRLEIGRVVDFSWSKTLSSEYIKDRKMLSFSKAKVGRHWASKFDLLIPDLTCFQCQAPSQNFQTNVTTTTKTIRMGTCLKKEYICVQKNLPGSWDTQYKMQILELWKKLCLDLQALTKYSESTLDL